LKVFGWNPFNAEWTGHQDILIDWPSVVTWLWLLTLALTWLISVQDMGEGMNEVEKTQCLGT
jgi:hypothetical protein